MTDIETIRARLQREAAQDTTQISEPQAATVRALFGNYRVTLYRVKHAGDETHRRTTNAERHAILGYLTGATIHAADLTAGWYAALFQCLVNPTDEVTAALRAILAAEETATERNT